LLQFISATGAREGDLVPKQLLDKISIYVPKGKLADRPVERLIQLAEKKDRSVNYLVVEAIMEYLQREESE
jgi:hypothetical protein